MKKQQLKGVGKYGKCKNPQLKCKYNKEGVEIKEENKEIKVTIVKVEETLDIEQYINFKLEQFLKMNNAIKSES